MRYKKHGGLTEDADISNVNLAYVLDDGIKIKIPSNLDIEEENVTTEDNGENIIEKNNTQENNTSSKGININKANTTELETLPGIGPSLASKIVRYREENGKFSTIEDLKKVNGIGDSKYENIKNLISVK